MSSSPQRQREQGPPSKHTQGVVGGGGGGGGASGPGYPVMYGAMANHHYNMAMKTEFDSSPQRYGHGGVGGPHMHQGGGGGGPHQHPFPPQGYHPLAQHGGIGVGVGQFGQYHPYYGAYGGPPNGYFPTAHHGGDLGGRGGVGGGTYGGGGVGGGVGVGGHFPSLNRKHSAGSGPKGSPQTKDTNNNSSSNNNNNHNHNHNNNTASNSPKEDTMGMGKESSPREAKSSPRETGQGRSSSTPPKDDIQGYDQDELASDVNPMKSDFHFYAFDNKQETLDAIETKAKATTKSKDKEKEKDHKDDDNKENSEKASPFQIMTELNERLIKMWEDTKPSVRNLYMQKEESDRYRFMSEDEIASRHCATLTSRTTTRKSVLGLTAPNSNSNTNSNSTVANVVTKDEEDDSQEKTGLKRQSDSVEPTIEENGDTSEYESPTKKIKEDPIAPKDNKDKKTEEGEGADSMPQNELMKEDGKEEGNKKEDKPEEATPKEKGDEKMASEVNDDGANS